MNIMNVHSLMEKLRPIVGLKSWDYCVVWKLGDEQRFLEWVGCCCGGVDNDQLNTQNSCGEELPMFPVSSAGPCRDLMFQHPRTINCDLLAQLPSSIPLDSPGAHAQSLISNQPRWLILPNCSSDDSGFSEETVGTRVLMPVPGGLIEFFVAKQVPEDSHIIEFVMAQCNLFWEQQDVMIMNMRMNSQSTNFHDHNHQHRPIVHNHELIDRSHIAEEHDDGGGFPVDDNGLNITNQQPSLNKMSTPRSPLPSNLLPNHFGNSTWVPSSPLNLNTTTTTTTMTSDVNFNLPWDLSVDRIRLCSSSSSPMNLFGGGSIVQQQQNLDSTVVVDSIVLDDLKRHIDDDHDLRRQQPTTNISGYTEFGSLQESLMSDTANLQCSSNIGYSSLMTTKLQSDPAASVETGHDKDRDLGNCKQGAAVTGEMAGGRADSVSGCSTDQMVEDDDDDDQNKSVLGAGRSSSSSGRPNQSKNLFAERKRRKKLSERLYRLRALVPNISKMDRASILGDAIDFVKELQKQVKDLQDELEEPAGEQEDSSGGGGYSCRNVNNKKHTMSHQLDHKMPNLHHQNGTSDLHHHPAAAAGTTTSRCSSINSNNNNAKMVMITGANSHHPSKHNGDHHDSHDNVQTADDKQTQQMEVQVEVTQIDRNEFFLKVFCEHKPGGFVRLMEAMNSLGLEVTNANVTTFRGLVLNVFKVEKRDDEMVLADHVRDSLLELTRDRTGGAGWSSTSSEPAAVVCDQGLENNGSGNINSNGDYDHDHRHHHHHIINSHHHSLHHFHHQG